MTTFNHRITLKGVMLKISVTESESASQKMGCALETKLVTLYTASIWHPSSRPFWLLSIDLYQWNCEMASSNLGEVFLMGAQISAPLL